jgi:hypothetical protein
MLADFVCIEPARGFWRQLDPESLLFGCVPCSLEIKTVVVGGTTVVSK